MSANSTLGKKRSKLLHETASKKGNFSDHKIGWDQKTHHQFIIALNANFKITPESFPRFDVACVEFIVGDPKNYVAE
jgi:hypothetical protein